MKTRTFAIAALFLALCFAPAIAQPAPTIQATLDPTSGTVGDVFTYSATVTWPEGLSAIPPDPEGKLGDCEILQRQAGDLELVDGQNSLSMTIKLACYESGEHIIPPLEVRYTNADGAEEMVKGPEFSINILRTLPEDAQEIRDIKGQQTLPPDYITPLAIAAGALITMLAFYLLITRLRRRKKAIEALKIKAPEPYPYAIERFQSGKLEKRLEREDFDGFYSELTDILREYLDGRFEVEALEMSTSEISRALKEKDRIDGFLKTDLLGILRHADMAKFAGLFPDFSEAKSDIEKGRGFVEKTRPSPVHPENGKPEQKEGEK